MMEAGVPYRAMNLHKVIKKSSVDREVATSRWTAVVVRQMNRAPYLLVVQFSTVTHFYWYKVVYGCPVEGLGEHCKSFSR